MFPIILNAFRETLVMVILSGILSTFIGLLLGLFITSLSLQANRLVKMIFILLANGLTLLNSIPFLLLMLLLLSCTNLLPTNSTYMALVATIPLTIAGSIFFANCIQLLLSETPQSIRVTANAMGATNMQTIIYFILPENWHKIAIIIKKMLVLIVSLSTIAGTLGYGGLGQLAIEKAIHQHQPIFVLYSLLTIVILNQFIEQTGELIADRITKR